MRPTTLQTYESYLQSPEWEERRQRIIWRDGYKCRLCNASDNVAELQVHHRQYSSLRDEKDEDLVTLCGSCHEIVTDKIGRCESLHMKLTGRTERKWRRLIDFTSWLIKTRISAADKSDQDLVRYQIAKKAKSDFPRGFVAFARVLTDEMAGGEE